MANETWLDDLLGYKRVIGDGGEQSIIEYPQRSKLYLLGDGVTIADDPTTQSTKITIGGGLGGGGASVSFKDPVRAATTAPITTSGEYTLDDVPLAAGDRVLVKDQVVASQNGIYVVSAVAWSRAADMDTDSEAPGAFVVAVSEGTENGNTVWILTSDDPIVLGTTALSFQKVGSGDATSLRGQLLDATVATPTQGYVVVFDGANYTAAQLSNASIAAAAAIAVSKLAAGANGTVLKSTGGVAAWGTLTAGDLGEILVTAPTITGNQDNYSPTGWATATIVRLTTDGTPRVINGLATSTVRRKLLINVGPQIITLKHLASGQVAGNQIDTAGNSDFALHPGDAVTVVYDTTSAVWRPVEQNLLDRSNTWSGGQSFSNGFTATAATITTDLTVVDDVSVGGDLTVTGNVSIDGEYGYGFTPPLRTVCLPLDASYPIGTATTGWSRTTSNGGRRVGASTPTGAERWVFQIPTGSVLRRVRVAGRKANGGGTFTLDILRQEQTLTFPYDPTITTLRTLTFNTALTEFLLDTDTGPGGPLNEGFTSKASTTFMLDMGGEIADTIRAIVVDFEEATPSNA